MIERSRFWTLELGPLPPTEARQVAPNWYVAPYKGRLVPKYGRAPVNPQPIERTAGRFCGACRDACGTRRARFSLICWVALCFLVVAICLLVMLVVLAGRIPDSLDNTNASGV